MKDDFGEFGHCVHDFLYGHSDICAPGKAWRRLHRASIRSRSDGYQSQTTCRKELARRRDLCQGQRPMEILVPCVDKAGNTVDFLLRAHCDKAAARRYFELNRTVSPRQLPWDAYFTVR